LLAELGHQLWIGDSAKIRANEVRKQTTDERDARLILDSPARQTLSENVGSYTSHSLRNATKTADPSQLCVSLRWLEPGGGRLLN
jgi:hypothetical protein